MADTPVQINTDHSISIKWYIGILIAVILLFIYGVWRNIELLNKQFDRNNGALLKSKQSRNPLTNLKVDSTGVYKLKEEDLQKFNNHIDYLTEKVDNEVKRTQENNQYDIDRINTFLAIGIGLLAIIGGLLPIFVNFFSKAHLEKQMDSFQDDCKKITAEANEAKDKADKAKEKTEAVIVDVKGLVGTVGEVKGSVKNINDELPKLKEGIDELKKAAKKVPYIDLLGFQNAVARLTSTDAMKLFVGDERIKWIVGYLENLILAINNFDDGIHSFSEYSEDNLKVFKAIISELKVALFLGPIRRIPDSRAFQSKIDEAVVLLTRFDKLEVKDYKEQLRAVSKSISALMELVERKSP